MNISELSPPSGSRKRRKIVGRGDSSGHGRTSGRGHKGQMARSGRGPILGFEGGQTPLIRRIPKRGFNSLRRREEIQIVNIKDLVKFSADALITPELLEMKGLIKDKNRPVKILGDTEINRPLIIKASAFSKSAQSSIEAAGGKVECLRV